MVNLIWMCAITSRGRLLQKALTRNLMQSGCFCSKQLPAQEMYLSQVLCVKQEAVSGSKVLSVRMFSKATKPRISLTNVKRDLNDVNVTMCRKDGLDPTNYYLIYNNIHTDWLTSRWQLVRLGTLAVVVIMSTLSLTRIYQDSSQSVLFLYSMLYIVYLSLFGLLLRFHRQSVLRLYKKNYGDIKAYVLVRLNYLTSTKQIRFSEYDIIRKNSQSRKTGTFTVKESARDRKYFLRPQSCIQGYDSVIAEILGYRLEKRSKINY